MANAPPLTTAPQTADWLGDEKSRVPSWLVSALLHGLFLACWIVLSQTEGCRPGYSGEGGESFRNVGVYLTEGDTDDEPLPQEQPEQAEPAASRAVTAADFAESPLLDGPPIEMNLPTRSQEPVLGLGATPSFSTGGASSPSLATQAVTGAPPSIGTALGGATSMFGIADGGKRFVYVLDRSASMDQHQAIRVAKAELMSSLEPLDATQEFQVIFYNKGLFALEPRSKHSDMFRGIDTHRVEVARQIGSIDADGGTEHLPALKMAFTFDPDVIFFLTDAAEPALTIDELAGIKRRNNGGARIHCIEFGEGPSLQAGRGVKNFLQKLAEQNGGKYSYRDVTSFR